MSSAAHKPARPAARSSAVAAIAVCVRGERLVLLEKHECSGSCGGSPPSGDFVKAECLVNSVLDFCKDGGDHICIALGEGEVVVLPANLMNASLQPWSESVFEWNQRLGIIGRFPKVFGTFGCMFDYACEGMPRQCFNGA